MSTLPSSRLRLLAHKYARLGDVPAGEAFQQAFRRFLKANRESLLDITVAAASVQISVGDGPQDVDPLLLKAIHDTNPTLTETNLFALEGDALQGAVNTAKGKYFEYLVVERLNQGQQVGPLLLEPGQQAVLAESMTQPGWDLRIVDEHGAAVEYLQLKATDSVAYIRSALERYPDIQILATGEVADGGLVLDSGITDRELRAHVELGVDAVDVSLTENFLDHFHPLLPLAAMAMYEGYRLWVGQQSVGGFKLALARRSQRMVVTQAIGARCVCHGRGAVVIPGSRSRRPGVRQNHQSGSACNVVPVPPREITGAAPASTRTTAVHGGLMGFFSWLANGLGTLIGVVTEVVSTVVDTVRSVYETFVGKGGAVKDVAVEEARHKKDRLREVNDEIMHLRHRGMDRGGLSDQERKRWHDLREEREELLGKLHQAKEVKAAEKILDSEAVLEKVEVDLETTHVLQYNAFADTLGKTCKCGRPMKLQWQRDLNVAGPRDFFWACTGWYVPMGEGRACTRREPLQRSDYALMTDTSAPEFSVTAEEFGVILEDPGTAKIITSRVNDLRSDLASKKQGVELATCPVHGQNMVLRKKSNPTGLLDAYFLACPHWQPNGQGCSFIEKLKSGSQLAALLKAETGRGIL